MHDVIWKQTLLLVKSIRANLIVKFSSYCVMRYLTHQIFIVNIMIYDLFILAGSFITLNDLLIIIRYVMITLSRSPERPINRARRVPRGNTDDSGEGTPPEPPALDQLPGVRMNPAFRPARGPGHRRRIILHNTSPPEQSDNPQPLVRPIGAMRPLLGEREGIQSVLTIEYVINLLHVLKT